MIRGRIFEPRSFDEGRRELIRSELTVWQVVQGGTRDQEEEKDENEDNDDDDDDDDEDDDDVHPAFLVAQGTTI